MLEEQYQRSDGRTTSGASEDAAADAPIPAAAPAPAASMPRVEGVPSEQLWRAAILAARQAALAAADLRRALAEAAVASAPRADESGATLVS